MTPTRWNTGRAKCGNSKEHLEQRFQTRITDEKLREAIRLMNRERGLRRQLADLMTADNPPLTGRQLIEFKSIISGIEADLQQYERAIQLFGDKAAGPKTSTAAGQMKPRVRVMLTAFPLFTGAERVLEISKMPARWLSPWKIAPASSPFSKTWT